MKDSQPPDKPSIKPYSEIRVSRGKPVSPSVDWKKTVIIALLLLGLALGYLAFQNHRSANSWKQKAETEYQLALDWKKAAAENEATAESLDSQLTNSERDVNRLSARQTTLANEKAQVEDQRETLSLKAAALQVQGNSLRKQVQAVVEVGNQITKCRNSLYDAVAFQESLETAACIRADQMIANYNKSYVR